MTRFITAAFLATTAIGITAYASLRSSTTTRTTDDGHLVFVDEENNALLGYDVVSYFTDGRPSKGDDRYVSRFRGATWKFASQAHKDTFDTSPEQFLPAYGGYCAWGVAAKNDIFDGDPHAWKIVDGRLFLNVNQDIQKKWLQDIPGFIRQADGNWDGIQEEHNGTAT